ncbi:MAG: hypothetical protein GEV00_20975 [Actinophytocola sp.]|nr:hypothetical protein [Actinophytocola sp.]
MNTTSTPSTNHRICALLRAVGDGRAEMTVSSEPDLFIDGVCCCDQYTAHVMARDGLLRADRPGRAGQRVPATLTPAGSSLAATLT